MGLGGTVERIVQDQPARFLGQGSDPAALAIGNRGPPWTAEFGFNPHASQALVQVITPDDTELWDSNIYNPLFGGHWACSLTLAHSMVLGAVLVLTSMLMGSITRLSHFHPPNSAAGSGGRIKMAAHFRKCAELAWNLENGHFITGKHGDKREMEISPRTTGPVPSKCWTQRQ
jgi:hypothetical protein